MKLTFSELTQMMSRIVENWNAAVIECAFEEHRKISMNEFLSHCTAQGGNWGGMLLSGLKELYPKTYAAIPDRMGAYAFELICDTLALCGVNTSKEGK